MVNETILNYLKSYFNKFPIEKLKEEIISKGYTAEEFEEALKIVSPEKEMPKPLEEKPEFKRIPSQPVPTKKKEKQIKEKKTKPVKEKKTKVKPESTLIPKRAREGTRKAKAWPWILLLIVLLAIGVIILNYYGISVFGFNIFRLI